jgi:hypothetical protein
MPPRTAPLAGSEELLRQYIEALGRGEPNYDRMTSEVAAQTRQQLPLNQAILSRLGALRAVSFRGVSSLGSDIYMAHFANGSAEWRIGLVKDGTIGRIARVRSTRSSSGAGSHAAANCCGSKVRSDIEDLSSAPRTQSVLASKRP